MKKKNYPLEDILLFSRFIDLGFRSGRDLLTSLKAFQDYYKDLRLQTAIDGLRQKIQLNGISDGLLQQNSFENQVELRMLYQLLMFSQASHHNLNRYFQRYQSILIQQIRFQKELQTQIFVPKLQAIVSAFIVALFAFGLPLWMPQLFPTFASLGRPDLALSAWAFMGIGFWFSFVLSKKPLAFFYRKIRYVYFFHFLSLYLDSGVDLRSAWIRTEKQLFEAEKKRPLQLQGAAYNSTDQLIKNVSLQTEALVRPLLIGLGWVFQSGLGLPAYLKQSGDELASRVLLETEAYVKKVSALMVFPLLFCIFPASLFLLIGPLLMQMRGMNG